MSAFIKRKFGNDQEETMTFVRANYFEKPLKPIFKESVEEQLSNAFAAMRPHFEAVESSDDEYDEF